MENIQPAQSDLKSSKVIIKILALLILGAIVIVAILRDRIVNPPQWTSTVMGRGRVAYEPDIAVVNLGVRVERYAAADTALRELNRRMNSITEALKKLDVPDDAVKTQNYALGPQYDIIENRSVMVGYEASQSLDVKIADLKKKGDLLSKVIAEGTKAGVNVINGVSFDVSNLEDLKQEARLKAIEDARSKAVAIAKTAGVSLKRVVSWWENFVEAPGTPGYYSDGKGGMGGGGVPVVPAGKNEIVVEIGLTYQMR